MGLWDKVESLKSNEETPKWSGKPSKGHSHNGRPCKSYGSCAILNFEKMSGQKKDIAKKMPKKDHKIAGVDFAKDLKMLNKLDKFL